MKYRINELDVWGNSEDGYEINDILKTDYIIDLENPYNDSEVIAKIKEFYNLPDNLFSNLNNFVGNDIFELENESGEYILQLEKV